MRELKFRIWNGFQFVTKSEVYIKACNGSLWDYDDGNLWSATAKIQQFTGLLDKNGKEIYEGDIVTYTSRNGKDYKAEIVFSPTLAAFVLDTSRRHLLDDKYGDYYELHKDHSYEVVGNIFENGELLK